MLRLDSGSEECLVVVLQEGSDAVFIPQLDRIQGSSNATQLSAQDIREHVMMVIIL